MSVSTTLICLIVTEEKRASPHDDSPDLSYTQPILGLDDSLSRSVFLCINSKDIRCSTQTWMPDFYKHKAGQTNFTHCLIVCKT